MGIIDMDLKIIKVSVKSIGDKKSKYEEKFPIYMQWENFKDKMNSESP